jgi:hypothetical protein
MSYEHHGKSQVDVVREHRSTLNDLPIPEGSWQEAHSKRNATFNLILAGGVIAFVSTFIFMKSTGTFYMHGKPDLKKVHINP